MAVKPSVARRGTALPIELDERGPLGRVLSVLRESLGMTRGELADAVDLSEVMIAKVEQGAKSPSQERFVRICEALRIHPDLVFESMRSPAFAGPPGVGVRPDEEMPEEMRTRIAKQLEAVRAKHTRWRQQQVNEQFQPIWAAAAVAAASAGGARGFVTSHIEGSLRALAPEGASDGGRREVLELIFNLLALLDDRRLAKLAHLVEAVSARPQYLDELLAASEDVQVSATKEPSSSG